MNAAASVAMPDMTDLRAALGQRAIVLVGMMGSGKSSVGRRLAGRLGLPFVDADTEIETAAHMTIPEIFAQRGEAEFREGERRVISRVLTTRAPLVLATGGGGSMMAEARGRGRDLAFRAWLRADPAVRMRGARRRSTRPRPQPADPEATLRRMLAEREPVYALADITILSSDEPHEVVVGETIAALDDYLRLAAGATAS